MTFGDSSAIADRVRRLGTGTALAVSAGTAKWREQGHTVYPFHLGDMDLPTPDNVVEACLKAIRDGRTGSCPNAGIPALREALAADVGVAHGLDYGPENVAIQPSGKPVIGKFVLAFMDAGDEVPYPNPGYPIYESQIESRRGRRSPTGTWSVTETSRSTMTGWRLAWSPQGPHARPDRAAPDDRRPQGTKGHGRGPAPPGTVRPFPPPRGDLLPLPERHRPDDAQRPAHVRWVLACIS